MWKIQILKYIKKSQKKIKAQKYHEKMVHTEKSRKEK